MAQPTEDEIELNHRIVDDVFGPVDWDAMPPVELWDDQTEIIYKG